MLPMRRVLARTFPGAATFYKAARSRIQRLTQGEGDVRVFDRIMVENYWQDPESVSGGGSNLQQTERLRSELPRVLSRLQVRSFLDAPCGDFNWMRLVDLGDISYTGIDVVAPLIEQCEQRFGSPSRQFMVRNLLTDQLPTADAVMSRDCLSHLSNEHIYAALRNFRTSGATYLLATTYPTRTRNWDIVTGSWRPVNLQVAPFGFPEPVEMILEGSTEFDGDFADKSIGVWRLDSLKLPDPR